MLADQGISQLTAESAYVVAQGGVDLLEIRVVHTEDGTGPGL